MKTKLPIFTALLLVCFCNVSIAQKVETIKKFDTSKANVTAALNAYSFVNELDEYAKTGKGMSIFDLVDYCAANNIPALDATGYFLLGYPTVPSDEYIYALKKHAHKMGVDISGTGIRNNFANPDPASRAADVKLAKEWIDVASKLGAPVIRVFAGAIPAGYENNWDVPAGWIIECMKECAAYGQQRGVLVGIQNHGDMIRTADQAAKILNAVNSPWAGLILDTGYFMTDDPYKDIEAAIPYTVNWQVKESAFGANSKVPMDFARLIKIINKSGYKGYLPVETLRKKGIDYDPYVLVPKLISDVNVAIESAKTRK